MKRNLLRYTVVFLTAAMLLTASVPLSAADTAHREQDAADALNSLGLFKGTENGYELEREATRAEAVTMIVRLLGAENEAAGRHPFTDVPAWADGYIAYAYANGITRGVSVSEFAPSQKIPAYQFMTMLLRVIGYSDTAADADFSWDSPYALALKCGMCAGLDGISLSEPVSRGTMVMLCAGTLKATPKSGAVLFSKLIAKGVFTASDFATCASSISWTDAGRPAQTLSEDETAAAPTQKAAETTTAEPSSLIPPAATSSGTIPVAKTEETTAFDNTNPTSPGDNPVSLDTTASDTTDDAASSGTGGSTGGGTGGSVTGGSETNQSGEDNTAETEAGWSRVIKP